MILAGERIADTTAASRVLETSHPPVYYLPVDSVAPGVLTPSSSPRTFCEWKGLASYLDVSAPDGRILRAAAWTYPEPSAPFRDLLGTVAFYPALMDECTVDGEAVLAQPGDFYGGWITSEITGPFKGPPGTLGW